MDASGRSAVSKDEVAAQRAKSQAAALTTAAAELYALAPGEFTDARNARAKALRQSGDKDLSGRVRRFAKPSTAAWLTNMLTTRRRKVVDEVLELGGLLRQAQADLDQQQLKALSQRRNVLLAAVAKQARALAEELGHPVSEAVMDDVEQTLRASMADPGAAEAVTSGLLLRALESSGWEPVDLTGAVAVPEVLDGGTAGRDDGSPGGTVDDDGTPGGGTVDDDGTVAGRASGGTRRSAAEKKADRKAQREAAERSRKAQQDADEHARRNRREGANAGEQTAKSAPPANAGRSTAKTDREATKPDQPAKPATPDQPTTPAKQDQPAKPDDHRTRRAKAAAELEDVEDRTQKAEAAAEKAARALAKASDALTETSDALAEASERHHLLRAELKELKARIRDLEREITALEDEEKGLNSADKAKAREAKEARADVERARKRLERP